MQRTDSIFFISGKQICGRKSPGGSLNSLSQTRVTRNEIGEIYIGLHVQDFKIISTHSLIRETKQMQSSIKKSGWIIDHLRAGVHKNQTLSGKLQNFKIAQTLAVSNP